MSATGSALAPIFIVGCPRSGTTLLQRMLDAHPEVAIAPETFFVRRFARRRSHYGRLDDPRHRAKLLADLAATPEFREMGLGAADFGARVERRAARSAEFEYRDLFDELLRAFAESRGKPRVGEKTPNHLLAMPLLESWFPRARFVHLVRDPRAVAESWRNVPWSNGSLEKDAEVWRRYMATARREPPAAAPLIELRYESLATEPERELRALCGALELDFDPAMLRFHERPEPGVDVGREPWKAEALQAPHAGGVARWRERLSGAEVLAVEAVAFFEMRRKEYAPATPLLRLLPAALRRALHRLRERRSRARRDRAKGPAEKSGARAATEAAAAR